MPTEDQELQLKVTLDDQASAQLAQISRALAELGGSSGGIGHATARIGEFEKALGSLGRQSLGVGRTAVELAKAIGPMPVALGTLAYQFTRSSEATKQWSDTLVASANAARAAGVSIGEFRGIVSSMRQSGISAEAASTMIVRFTKAYGELMLMGSNRREQLIQIAGPQFAGDMMMAIKRVGELQTDTEKLQYIQEIGENVYRNELTKSGDAMLAASKRNTVYELMGVPEMAAAHHKIEALDDQTIANMKAEAAAMEELNAAQEKEADTRGRIGDILRSSVAPLETWMVTQADFIEHKLLALMEEEEERIRTHGLWYNFFYFPGMEKALPQGEAAQATPGMGFGYGFQHGGIVTRPTVGMLGEAGPEAVIPLSKLWGSDQPTNENTKELSRLAFNLRALLESGAIIGVPKAYAEGGVITKPTLAKVGEAGPEIVSNRSGSFLADQATVGILGTDGPTSVVPLTGARSDQQNRPAHYQGMATVGGQQFRFGSGTRASPSLPYGTYGLDPDPSAIGPAGQKHQAIASLTDQGVPGNLYDPMLGRQRTNVQLHAEAANKLDQLYTLGCIGVDKRDWPQFREAYAQEAAQNNGKLYLTSTPEGVRIGGAGTVSLASADPWRVKNQLDNVKSLTAPTSSGLSNVAFGGVTEGRSNLDRMMGNQMLNVAASGQIKINHENAPEGAEVETEGDIFKDTETSTTRMPFETHNPFIDTARTVSAWAHRLNPNIDRPGAPGETGVGGIAGGIRD
jgi:hypothetical protein